MPYVDKNKALEASRKSYAKLMTDSIKREARATKHAAYMREYYHKNAIHREGVKRRGRRWREENLQFSNLQLNLRRYGLTLDQYHAKVESQNEACAICGAIERLVIDHNHVTEKARGLLCRPCNTGIGMLKESPELFKSALSYLERWF